MYRCDIPHITPILFLRINLERKWAYLIVIDRHSHVPVYEQMKNQITSLIRIGVYEPHSKLPSIRLVAAQTGVNVNTVKKAFAELEQSGVIYSVPGTGSFVSENALASSSLRADAFSDIKDAVRSAKSRGIDIDEIIAYVNNVFKEDESDD